MKKKIDIANVEVEVLEKHPHNSGMITADISKNGMLIFKPTENKEEALTTEQIKELLK